MPAKADLYRGEMADEPDDAQKQVMILAREDAIDTRPAYQPEAAKQAWRRTLNWFSEHLR